MKRLLATLAGVLLLVLSCPAWAAVNLCSTVPTVAGSATAVVTALSSACAWTTTQIAIGNLTNINGGTIVGNNTGSAAAPAASIAPVVGIAGTSSGTLGLANSAGGTVTLGGGSGAVTNYTLQVPNAAPVSNGQALTATTAGVGSWSTIVTAAFTVTPETASYNVLAAADGTRYDNVGAAGTVIGTLPAAPVAGDNWCFLVGAAQIHEILANTGETINFGGTISASAGNIQNNVIGSSACLYFESATKAYVWAATGAWQVN